MNHKAILLDTSGDRVEVAYFCGNKQKYFTDYIEMEGRQAAVNLLPAIDAILRRNNAEVSQLTAVGAVRGPGSFTGLRIAVCTANAFAYSLQVPLFTLSSLEAIARAEQGWVTAVRDASNGLSYLAVYNSGEEVDSPICVPNSEVQASVKGKLIASTTNEQGLKNSIAHYIINSLFIEGEIEPIYIRQPQVIT